MVDKHADPTAPAAGATPRTRPMKAYAFDPTLGRSLGNFMTIQVPYEKLFPGPVGRQIAVIDYDSGNDCYYEPVDLDDASILLTGGLDPTEADPRFHQQMVYAVVTATICRFESALGRPIRWRFSRWARRQSETRAADPLERERLRVFPHAMQEANAYYSRDLRGLVFGYFPAVEANAGANLPGQTVFTCLSHDIVAHETTHALVDSQRDFFMESTSVDAPAFHEAFADIVALFEHFSYRDALIELIQRTGGLVFRSALAPEVEPGTDGPMIGPELTSENPLVGLAKQFGEAMGTRRSLRSALGTPPKPGALEHTFEPHARGSILVAAVFDAYFSIYVRRTADLMRIARSGGAVSPKGDVHPDLARRLADAAATDAERFFNICVRALDYCPPVDIRFGDFLRALVTADYDLVPEDRVGYRAALIDAFRARGITPDGVASYSEESLRWCAPDVLRGAPLPKCEGLVFDVFAAGHGDELSAIERATIKEQSQQNAVVLNKFATKHRRALGLSQRHPIQARTFHMVHRVGPDGRVDFNIVAELMQRAEVPLDAKNPGLGKIAFRGGTTLILARDGSVRYAIMKPIGDSLDPRRNHRLSEQLEYQTSLQSGSAAFCYGDPQASSGFKFANIHRGYP
jgi:hypothetical protein